jgi:hypothetical protein
MTYISLCTHLHRISLRTVSVKDVTIRILDCWIRGITLFFGAVSFDFGFNS